MDHIVVIDTNQSAGIFYRDICAYITRQVGYCGVGQWFADIAEDELTEDQVNIFSDSVDPSGGPCSIWESNIGVYKSVAISFYEAPSKETMQLIKERAMSFTKYRDGLYIQGVRLFRVIPERYEQVKF